jgi:SRSO17 transposase
MTEEQILALGPALADFLDRFLFCCGYTQTFAHLGTYCRGLLSDLPRKSVEPIALAAGVPVRTLQEFLRDHAWDHRRVTDLLAAHVADALAGLPDEGGLGAVGLVDETGIVKKGDQTPGVQRQHCGEVGKQENCVVTVHLGVCKGRYKTLLDADLYLPQSWDADRGRCRAAGIPDEVVYRPKWQIALAQWDRAKANGLRFGWLTFDEGYGDKPGFVEGLAGRGQRFVGEVPRSLAVFAARPRPGQAARRADELVRHSPRFTAQPWRTFRLARQTLGPQAWQAKAARVWLSVGGRPSERPYWLVWARNERTAEEKYFVGHAAASARLGKLLRVGFCRWNVEHGLRLSKTELGLRHYEGRHYLGLMRHQALCLLMLSFVADQAGRLRGEKPGGDRRAGVPGPERGLRGVAGGAAGDEPVTVHGGGHRLPPAAEPGGAGVAAAAGGVAVAQPPAGAETTKAVAEETTIAL